MKRSNAKGMTIPQINKAIHGKKEIVKNKSISEPINKNKSKKPNKILRKVQNHDFGLLLNLPYSMNLASRFPTPQWFTSTEKADVSVIVPIYKSSIENLVESWDFNCDGMKVEFIFIDDECPLDSKSTVVSQWEPRKNETKKPIGKIYQNSATQGWGACCNTGAELATGDILIFLNPQGKLFPGWLPSMIRLIRKSNVGVVGGLHVNEMEDCVIESGREWSWKENRFMDIGSQCYQGKDIYRPFQMTNTPIEVFQASEREVVSSNLMAVMKQNFLNFGGFSPNVFTQEWSDADFCMSVREHGMKVMYQPNARLYHLGIEKKDKYWNHGSTWFENKWVSSERLDSIVKDKRSERRKINNILIRRQAAHGDVLVAAGIIPALKKRYPDSKILFSTECVDVLKNNPLIDKIIEEHSERQFDLFLNLDMVYEYRPNINILQAYAEAAGVNVNDCKLFLHSEPIDFELPDKYVVIHAGKTMWVGRNWSTIKFDQLSNKIKSLGYQIICIGTESDHKVNSCDLDLRGKTTIHQLATVIKNSQLFVGIDSFPMHIAQTFDVNGVCFFGSIIPNTRILSKNMIAVFADGLKCLGCHHRKSLPCTATTVCEVGVQECVNGISVEMMFNKVKQALKVS